MNIWQRLRLFVVGVLLIMFVFALKAQAFTDASCDALRRQGCECEAYGNTIMTDCSAIRGEEKEADVVKIWSYLHVLEERMVKVEEAVQ